MAESAKIGHNLAESTHLGNGFYPLLKGLEHSATHHSFLPLSFFERENRLDESNDRAIDDPSGHFIPRVTAGSFQYRRG